jgi:hypothetical protein
MLTALPAPSEFYTATYLFDLIECLSKNIPKKNTSHICLQINHCKNKTSSDNDNPAKISTTQNLWLLNRRS